MIIKRSLFVYKAAIDENTFHYNPGYEEHFLCCKRMFLGQEEIWLPPRDSNPDNLLQRQVSYH